MLSSFQLLGFSNFRIKLSLLQHDKTDPGFRTCIRIPDLLLKAAADEFLSRNPWAFEYNKHAGYEPRVEMPVIEDAIDRQFLYRKFSEMNWVSISPELRVENPLRHVLRLHR